jgi:hypothetical protein
MHRDKQVGVRRVADIDARLELVEILIAIGTRWIMCSRPAITVDIATVGIDRGVSFSRHDDLVATVLQSGFQVVRLLQDQRRFLHVGRAIVEESAKSPVRTTMPGIKADNWRSGEI